MRAPSFWWHNQPSLLALLLTPIGWVYGRITAARMARSGAKAAVPVICIGNWTAGGAGKTPVAQSIARLLQAKARHPVFLSRGYGGRLEGPLAVNPAKHSPEDCGDEPLLLAGIAPTIIARDRVKGAELASTLGTVIIMDDGLQNPSLVKSLAFAVLDGQVGIGNGLCVPAGPLRAPIEDQYPLTDALIIINPGQADIPHPSGKPVFTGRLVADPEDASLLTGQNVMAVAGIGRPEKFRETLQAIGAIVCDLKAFPDHHAFTRNEIEALVRESERCKTQLVTTSKDHVRITAIAPDLAHRFLVLNVGFQADDEQALLDFIETRCGLNNSSHA